MFLISTKDSMLKLSKEEKKEFGIFFTPQVIIDEIISRMKKVVRHQTILEPSCGDGRFIKSLLKTFPEADVKGYELNEKVFNEVKLKFPDVEILNENYLNSPIDEKFDLIIGNPPYFITKDRIYNEYYTGRANIFIQFIIHSLKKLNPEGVLIFVIPETFLNCQYYSKTREYIRREFVIYDIYKNPNLFEDTKYDTITMIVTNVKPQINGLRNENDDWFYNDVIVYDPDLSNLINSKGITINDLMKEDNSLEISIGPFVWNQHKNQLIPIDSNEKLPVLIYKPNNLKKRSLVKMKDENENSNDFIDISQIILHQDVIIIYRGCGTNYKFEYELIKCCDYPNGFILENHLILIKTNNSEMLNRINLILKSEKTKEFIKRYITNGAINLNDLKYNIQLFQ